MDSTRVPVLLVGIVLAYGCRDHGVPVVDAAADDVIDSAPRLDVAGPDAQPDDDPVVDEDAEAVDAANDESEEAEALDAAIDALDEAEPDASDVSSDSGPTEIMRCADAGARATISPAFALPAPALRMTQAIPDVAFDGVNYLVVWEEGTGNANDWRILGVRVNSLGSFLDSTPIVFTGLNVTAPRIAFNGFEYVLVWSQVSGAIGSIRITRDGSLVGSPTSLPVGPSVTYATSASIACMTGSCLVAWRGDVTGGNSIRATRLDASGTPLDGTPIALQTDPGGDHPAVDVARNEYFVVWSNSTSGGQILYSRVSSTGVVLGGGGPMNSRPLFLQPPAVAFDGNNHVVVWSDWDGSRVQTYAGRVSLTGVQLDPGGFAVAPSATNQTLPAVGFDGNLVTAVWSDSPYNLLGRLVLQDGSVLPDDVSLALGGGVAQPVNARVASDGHGTSLWVWAVHLPTGATRIHARFVSTCAP